LAETFNQLEVWASAPLFFEDNYNQGANLDGKLGIFYPTDPEQGLVR
jgi:hypothetical protein